MISEICENCIYQSYEFLKKHDTICPFYYDFAKCFKLTEGLMDEIIEYDEFIDERTRNYLQS